MKKQKSNISIRQMDKSIVYLALAAILTVGVLLTTASTGHAVWVECRGLSAANRLVFSPAYETCMNARMDCLEQALNEIIGKEHPHYKEIKNTILAGEHIDESVTDEEFYENMRQNLKPYIVSDEDLKLRGSVYTKDKIEVYVCAGLVKFDDELILATVERVTGEPYKKRGRGSEPYKKMGPADIPDELKKEQVEVLQLALDKLVPPSPFSKEVDEEVFGGLSRENHIRGNATCEWYSHIAVHTKQIPDWRNIWVQVCRPYFGNVTADDIKLGERMIRRSNELQKLKDKCGFRMANTTFNRGKLAIGWLTLEELEKEARALGVELERYEKEVAYSEGFHPQKASFIFLKTKGECNYIATDAIRGRLDSFRVSPIYGEASMMYRSGTCDKCQLEMLRRVSIMIKAGYVDKLQFYKYNNSSECDELAIRFMELEQEKRLSDLDKFWMATSFSRKNYCISWEDFPGNRAVKGNK